METQFCERRSGAMVGLAGNFLLLQNKFQPSGCRVTMSSTQNRVSIPDERLKARNFPLSKANGLELKLDVIFLWQVFVEELV